MNILDIIINRRSVRDFKDQEIPPDLINGLIEAIRWAPSAGNMQSRKFYFVFDQAVKAKLAKAALNQNFLAKAPLVVVACLDRNISARYGERGVNLYSIQDVSASIMNMMLTAHAMGLGTVWMGAFNEFEVIEILELPDNLRPISLVPVGFPSKVPFPPRRIAQDEIVVMVKQEE
ncbi:MAG TPA: nitroreductase family protein [Nitrospirota bacterium]|nr:nitroreductase family protein [Nitrospirota bacterium]